MSFLEKFKKELEVEELKKSSTKKETPKQDSFETEGELAVDVYETKDELIIQSTIAGVKAEDLDISIENDIITIRGRRNKPKQTEECKYFYQECYWGPFSKQIVLPEGTNRTKTKASVKDGIFTLKIPKSKRKKRINIKAKDK
ncbi:MAG TPA: Hsp20/alpha crystallin family protein [bacterium]|nr:Hsp20/alpha crystallin family protein [bacterium]